MRVRIIGGGVAGLSLALALQERAGVDEVTIYERETSETLPRKLGHGLILMENGVSALASIGCADVLADSKPLRRAVIRTPGAALRDEAMGAVYSVTRAAIVEGLRARLGAGVLKLARRCVALHSEPTAGGRRRICALSFADGSREVIAADELVVDASGWRSPLCAALNPGYARRPSRVKELVTSTHSPELAARLGDTFVKTVLPGRGIAFGLLSPTPERVIGFLQFDAERIAPPPRGASEAALRDFLNEHLGDAPALVREYLAAADLSTAHVWHPVDADIPPTLHCDNAVIIGDAAHPLLPFTSQGVSAALEDSVILADTLAAIDDRAELPAALAGFAADRRADVAVYIDEGRRILADFVATGTPSTLPYIGGGASRLGEHLALPAPRIADLFAALDLNGDGGLDRVEYARALVRLDLEGDAEATFAELDADDNGRLDLGEIRRGLRGHVDPASSGLCRVRRRLSPRGISSLLVAIRASADAQIVREA
ncbi:MAG: hypothetical protein KC486_12840 [Myxococcales bacterium]|nr:hypothetical protein [Myxococcales bacterium]